MSFKRHVKSQDPSRLEEGVGVTYLLTTRCTEYEVGEMHCLGNRGFAGDDLAQLRRLAATWEAEHVEHDFPKVGGR